MPHASSTVVVIGAGSGIGRAVAQAASQAGAHVVLAGRTVARLNETAATLGCRHQIHALDAAALFAMSNSFLTGAVLPVDGGATHVNPEFRWALAKNHTNRL